MEDPSDTVYADVRAVEADVQHGSPDPVAVPVYVKKPRSKRPTKTPSLATDEPAPSSATGGQSLSSDEPGTSGNLCLSHFLLKLLHLYLMTARQVFLRF